MIDFRRQWSISAVCGRFKEKSTVGDRLRKKKERRRRRRRGEVPRAALAVTPPRGRPRAVAACGFFSPHAGESSRRRYRRFADIGQDVVVELRRDADDLLPPVIVVLGDHHGRRGDGGETPDGSRRRGEEVQRCEPPLGGAEARGVEREEGEKGRRREQRAAETQKRWEGARRHGIANKQSRDRNVAIRADWVGPKYGSN
ncbi:hypothetical protein GW17_00036597 [Ensete ventricosum]|nr:hypothetical protein GW17_00036597 [Ensete ventricosum]